MPFSLRSMDGPAVVAQVAHVHRVALSAFHGGGHVLPADGVHHHHLRVVHAQAVAGKLVAAQVEVEEVAAGHTLGKDAARARHRGQHVLDAFADALDLLQAGAVDLDPDRRAHARGKHVDAVLDGHGPGVGDAGQAQRFVHLVDQFGGGDVVGRDAE
jgi:hypothetical protein